MTDRGEAMGEDLSFHMKYLYTFICLLLSAPFSHSQEFTTYVECNGVRLSIFNDYHFLIVTNGSGDTLINVPGDYFNLNYRDLDEDGYVDIMADLGGNTPERYDLFLYVPKSKKFREVENFNQFPAPLKIPGSKYYFSYHKSGCADMDWDSDLFYLKNYQAVRIGNIAGRQCGGGDTLGIFIYKFSNSQKKLISRLNAEITNEYEDGKWGFIKQYWTGYWPKFVH